MGHEPSESRPKIGFIISSPHLLVSLTHLCLSFPHFRLHSGLGAQGVYFCNLPWLWGFPAGGQRCAAPPIGQSHGGQISGVWLTLPKGHGTSRAANHGAVVLNSLQLFLPVRTRPWENQPAHHTTSSLGLGRIPLFSVSTYSNSFPVHNHKELSALLPDPDPG